MKRWIPHITILLFLVSADAMAQYGYGNRYGSRYGRQRTAIPQTQTPPPEPEK